MIGKIEPQGTTNGFDKMRKLILGDNSEIGFIYGADGLRRKKVTSSGATNYLLEGLSVLAEYDDSGNILRNYVPGVSMSEGGSTYFYHYYALGSVRFISDTTGAIVQEYSYDAWGNVIHTSGSLNQPYQYVGEHYYYNEPSLGLQLLGQRWYDSKVGRFISRDPIGYTEGPNLYLYVENNPVGWFDPDGHEKIAYTLSNCYADCWKTYPQRWKAHLLWACIRECDRIFRPPSKKDVFAPCRKMLTQFDCMNCCHVVCGGAWGALGYIGQIQCEQDCYINNCLNLPSCK